MAEEKIPTPQAEGGDAGAAEPLAAPAPAPPGEAASPEAPAGSPGTAAEEPGARAVVEAMLYASGKPHAPERLAEAAELPVEAVLAALQAIERECEVAGRGVRLDRAAGGVRLVSRPEFDYPVRRLLGLDGRSRLSMAALETLAIVAYRQPITGPEIAELRGVNSSSSIRTLLDRKLITTAGRKEVVGTPFLYKTTKEFLLRFGLNALGELPKPEELEAVYGQEAPAPAPAQTELFPAEEAEVAEVAEAAEAAEAAGPDPAPPDGATAVPDDTVGE